MQFELFERKARPSNVSPMVGIQTRGTMSMNAAAFELLASTHKPSINELLQAKRVGKQTAKTADGADALIEFLFAKNEQVIGIRLASPQSVHAYPLRRQPKSESYLVTAKAFLGYHGIMPDKLRRFRAHLFEGGVLGFSLKEDEV